MILAMTPQTTAAKLLLIEDRRLAKREPSAPSVRRFRLARLRFDDRASDPGERFARLKRSFD
jgi:hypothetical protein